MGPVGLPEMLVIGLVILLLFGAKKLPELARGIGKSMGEFKKAKEDFEDEIKRGTDEGTAPSKSTPAPSQTVAQSSDDGHDDASDTEEAKAEEKKAETAV